MNSFNLLFNIESINNQGLQSYSNSITFMGLANFLTRFKINGGNAQLDIVSVGAYIQDGLITNTSPAFGEMVILNNESFISHISYINNDSILQFSLSNTLLHNILISNNNKGIKLSGNNNIKINDLYSFDNGSYELSFANGADDFNWTGDLFTGGAATTCTYGTGLGDIGLQNATCDLTGSPNVTRVGSFNSANIFNGFSKDFLNTHGASGDTGFSFLSITDWFNFDKRLKGWSPYDTGGLPNVVIQGNCDSGMCGIFDYSLKQNNTINSLFNRNGEFVADALCPESIRGSNFLESPSNLGLSLHHLPHTVEYPLDGIGNDNGICESGEYCYYIPGAGASSGDPFSYTSTCIYDSNGSDIVDVKIFGP